MMKRNQLVTFCMAILLTSGSLQAQTKLAQTPPMGWNSWNAFHLDITDAIIRAQAKALVSTGMKDAGYEYVVIDGGWEGSHDAQGVFHSNPTTFPDMKALCDYIHSLGLKVGIHTSPGPTTCAGHEASYGHEQQDAQTFANWGIDFVKYDWCSGDKVYKPEQMKDAYKKMSDALTATGRPILYSLCQYGIQDVWKWGPAVGGQMWRTTGDLQDSYFQMLTIGFGQNGLEKYAGPGHWNDPDMLEIGNSGMKPEEWRVQMTLWSILAAPLFAGNDLTKMNKTALGILTNPDVIAIDQDPAGIQGHRVWEEGPVQIWTKALADHSTAVAVFSIEGHPMDVAVDLKDLGLPENVHAVNLWQKDDVKDFNQTLTVTLPHHGVALFKLSANKQR
jgi:alpha-galactosidase